MPLGVHALVYGVATSYSKNLVSCMQFHSDMGHTAAHYRTKVSCSSRTTYQAWQPRK